MLDNQIVGVIGAGNIGRALMGGMIRGNLLASKQVIATRRTPAALEALEEDFPGLRTHTDNAEAAREATVLLLTIKPQSRVEVLSEIHDHVRPGTLLISVLAGITTQTLEQSFDAEVPVVRAMPNTPALVDEGATAIAGGRFATDDHLRIAQQIFDAVGTAEVLPDDRVIDRLPGMPVPDDRGFTLIGDANGRHLVRVDSGGTDGLSRRTDLSRPDLVRIVLDLARLRKDLFKLFLSRCLDDAVVVKQDGTRTRSALV